MLSRAIIEPYFEAFWYWNEITKEEKKKIDPNLERGGGGGGAYCAPPGSAIEYGP